MDTFKNRLNAFRMQIRRTQVHSVIKKLRYEVIENKQKAQIQELINIPLQRFTAQHLAKLVQYANTDETNAICHLGNLIIDRFVTAQALQHLQIKLGKNEYLTWLINSMAEINYCTSSMFEYLVHRISVKKSSFNLYNALQALHRCMKANPQHTLTYMDNKQELILALVNHVHDSNEKISTLSLGLIVSATSYSEKMPLQMEKVVGKARFKKCLLTALMKIQTHPRILAVQIANNLMLSGVILYEVIMRVLQNAVSQKQSVRLELSFYFNAMAKQLQQKDLLELIRKHELFQVLKDLAVQKPEKGKSSRQIRQNALKAIKLIVDRLSQKEQKEVVGCLYRLGLAQFYEEMIDQSEETMLYHQIQ